MGLVVRSGLKVANGLVGLGVEQIRWPAPARPGDILHIEIEVLEVHRSRSKPGWGVVKLLWRTLNQNGVTIQEAIPSCWVKAGVMLLDLAPASVCQGGLFENGDDACSKRLMTTLDRINRTLGKGALRYACEGFNRHWDTRAGRRTPAYTTRWDDLPVVRGK